MSVDFRFTALVSLGRMDRELGVDETLWAEMKTHQLLHKK